MLKQLLGEKVVTAGVNWGEAALRLFMGLGHAIIVIPLVALPMSRQEDEGITAFLLVGALVVLAFVAYQLRPVARAVWLSPKLTIYQKGISYQDRHGEHAWTWQELSHFVMEQSFGTTIYGTYVWRRGVLVVYVDDKSVFQIDRLMWNAPKIAQIVARHIAPPKPKREEVEEPRSTVHPLY